MTLEIISGELLEHFIQALNGPPLDSVSKIKKEEIVGRKSHLQNQGGVAL